MARKKAKLPGEAVFAGLLLIGLILLLVPHRITGNVNYAYQRIFAPILNVGHRTPVGDLQAEPSSDEYVSRSEYNKLWAANANLRAALTALQKKYEKLAQVREGLPEPGPALMLATVRRTTLDGMRQELLINKGRKDYVRQGYRVMEENSIVGTVVNVTDLTSTVQLVTDPRHSMEVLIWREGRRGVIPGQLVGDGKGGCRIPLLSREYDVQKGDSVYAAAKAGLLDVPIVIGVVSDVKPDAESPLLLDIAVTPVFEVEQLDSVAVILMDVEEVSP